MEYRDQYIRRLTESGRWLSLAVKQRSEIQHMDEDVAQVMLACLDHETGEVKSPSSSEFPVMPEEVARWFGGQFVSRSGGQACLSIAGRLLGALVNELRLQGLSWEDIARGFHQAKVPRLVAVHSIRHAGPSRAK